ncbi:DNA ligase 1 [Copidosoma floridanum]|uniref:DNA ligase 1 n=1 Tax=Copidosoma floridanum TaxID=29053 RepID=UPI0006C9C1C3|nr:DNA ligase 1 [Copidosoma floridanum]
MSDPDSELEDDEEEILVYVEFDNFATSDVFSNNNLKLDMLGLDSDHPVMQINGKFFEGTYEDAVGTYLFFEKDKNPEFDDQIFDKIPSLKYYNKTRKLLKMQRAFLVPKYEVVGDSKHSECIPNVETLKEAGVPPKYQEEALSFWKNSRDLRLNALNSYLKKQEFRKELRLRGFEPESESDEENPFAMYKSVLDEFSHENFDQIERGTDCNGQGEFSEENRSHVNNTATQISQKFTVIDPGPSTSKSSRPWIDDEDEENKNTDSSDDTDWEPFSKKVKSIGRIRSKVAKSKVVKVSKKKTKSNMESSNMSESLETVSETNDVQKSLVKNNEVDRNGKASSNSHVKKKKVKPIVTKIEEIEIGEVTASESDRLLSMELNLEDDVQRRKRERREAKLKEIRERMEALKKKKVLVKKAADS